MNQNAIIWMFNTLVLTFVLILWSKGASVSGPFLAVQILGSAAYPAQLIIRHRKARHAPQRGA